ASGPKLTTLDKLVSEADGHISNIGDSVAIHANRMSEVMAKLEAALDKIDDLVNRSRRCNLHAAGLPEGREGTNLIAFFRAWLPELLQISFKEGAVKLDSLLHAVRAQTTDPRQSY
ncbi:hypothetical protein XENOCAPTIV_024708, partial [Xenoophorus captivus]